MEPFRETISTCQEPVINPDFHDLDDDRSINNEERSNRSCRPVSLRKQKVPRLTCLRRFLLRIDVFWTIVFFLFVFTIGLITTAITQTQVQAALLQSWRHVHSTHLAVANEQLSLIEDTFVNMNSGFLALQGGSSVQFGSESILARLCAVLVRYDRYYLINTFTISSYKQLESTTCMHNIGGGASIDKLAGFVSLNHTVNATYFVDSESYQFLRPLQVAVEWPESSRNISRVIEYVVTTVPIFQNITALYDHQPVVLDWRTSWQPAPTAPHLISFNLPCGVLFQNLPLPDGLSVLDYVQIRLNGTQLLVANNEFLPETMYMAAFINTSLSSKYPRIMSNNWGQQCVFNEPIYTPLVPTAVDYLNISDIDSPLMREAIKHFDLSKLQTPGYNKTVQFRYRGAPALATAQSYTTEFGLTIPILHVSAQRAVTGPYYTILDILTVILVAVMLLFTAIFWYFVHTAFTVPLQRMTELLLTSVLTGRRPLYHPARHGGVHLTEVRNFADAHNGMMRRLQDIDEFIPEPVRRQQQQMELQQQPGTVAVAAAVPTGVAAAGDEEMGERVPAALQSLTMSVAYVAVRAVGGPAGQHARLPAVSAADVAGRPPHLVEVVESAAHAIGAVNSGPFATPDALRAFAGAVHDLSHERRGVVHQLTPERCIVHFAAAAQAHARHPTTEPACAPASSMNGGGGGGGALTPAQWEAERCVRSDARDAVGFALALQQWVDAYAGEAECVGAAPGTAMPDVRVLVDTAQFACGQYRALRSEQTMAVAFGRDVQREVGHVPALIGVRVAMTADTASRVRAKRDAVAGSSGTRQLPVEALCTGRPGLDADLVLLFEALPGPVAGDAAWRRYAHCCFDGFSRMLRGDYAGALRAYKAVADISDLEPGLMPHSLRREAASSDVVGGAVSTQAARLIAECVRRVLRNDTRPFRRGRHVPLGIDAVLKKMTPPGVVPETMSLSTPDSSVSASGATPSKRKRPVSPFTDAGSGGRCVIELHRTPSPLRTVIADSNMLLQDNFGQSWRVASTMKQFTAAALWTSHFPALGSAGALATTNFLVFRNVPVSVVEALRDAPLGPMSEALSKTIPVIHPSALQKRQAHTIFNRYKLVQHPCLLSPSAYSLTAEGGFVAIWEFNTGGSLRQVMDRYREIKPITVMRFAWYITGGLSYLHQRGLAHGSITPKNILIATDGRCRLMGHLESYQLTSQLFSFWRTSYVSPLTAAGAIPTPECDMYCFGLVCLEMLTHGKVWRWATATTATEGDVEAEQVAAHELRNLINKMDQPFFDGVVQGHIVPDLDVLEEPLMTLNENRRKLGAFIRSSLERDPSLRPSAADFHRELTRVLHENGVSIDMLLK